MKEKQNLEYPVLADAGNAYAKTLSLVHTFPEDLRSIYTAFQIPLPEFNGDDSWELPLATRLVVDGRGVILAIDTDPDYTIRPEVEASLAVLAG